jgi:Ca2+-binding RTX toxin-like protein
VRIAVLTLLAALLLAAPAHAATVAVEGGVLHVSAAPGEANSIQVDASTEAGALGVSDEWSPLSLAAGAGCVGGEEGLVSCPATGVSRVELDAGDGDDRVTVPGSLAATLSGGPGDDELTVLEVGLEGLSAASAATLRGGDGDDALTGAAGDDMLDGGAGDDTLTGADGDDRLDGARGRDTANGGAGDDALLVRDRRVDTAWCGDGRDRVRAEVLDSLDFACERVDYGPPGRIGRLRPVSVRGAFVPVPGQGGARVDRRILSDVLYLIRRYRVRVGDGYALHGHSRSGEHPLGLAVDLVPGPGGSWRAVDRLARWAEPRQNRPRPPFRWVGYTGDAGHGRGDHLHLSWDHTPGRPGRPVRTVWVWKVRR